MKVEWESCDFAWKCGSFPHSCDQCWKGKVHVTEGIRLNVAIANHTRTVIATLLHEILEYLFLKTRTRFLSDILNKLDSGKEA